MTMNSKPILSCAGRETVSIDSVLLNELLVSFKPTTIGIRNKAEMVAHEMRLIADGIIQDNAVEKFKSIITDEFLSIQLMEASKLARQSSAEAAVEVPLGDI